MNRTYAKKLDEPVGANQASQKSLQIPYLQWIWINLGSKSWKNPADPPDFFRVNRTYTKKLDDYVFAKMKHMCPEHIIFVFLAVSLEAS